MPIKCRENVPTRMRQTFFSTLSKLNWKLNNTVKRVKRGWRLPANYCFCARSISYRCFRLPPVRA
ncbi:hypothetical protein KCP77_14665 [Salmonella enterica subsp. enterica]|nr:hypothetical protein KCP77_14665 [Salmonella enterica subsp. enterica]